MTGGHIAILALLSLMAIIGEMFASAVIGIGVGLYLSQWQLQFMD